MLVRIFVFGRRLVMTKVRARCEQNARFSRIWAFIEHCSASGSALRGESYKRAEAFFFIERVGVRTKLGARYEEEKGSLRWEQRTGM